MSNFQDDAHALYCGCVLGMFWRNGVDAESIADEDGNYTDRLVVTLYNDEHEVAIELVIPPPPSGWTLEDWRE